MHPGCVWSVNFAIVATSGPVDYAISLLTGCSDGVARKYKFNPDNFSDVQDRPWILVLRRQEDWACERGCLTTLFDSIRKLL